VDGVVVLAAQHEQVVGIGPAAEDPPHDVVGVQVLVAGAAREPAVDVAGHQGASQCGVGNASMPTEVELGAVG